MIFALIGTVFALFGLLGVLAGAGAWLSYLHLGAGLGLVIYALVTSSGELRELAGRDASRRGLRLGGNALLQTVLLAVILAGVAYLSVRYPQNWDWTEAGVHTLSTGSADVLAQIPDDGSVEIYAFFTEGSEEAARSALGMYTYVSDRVRFSIFDPNRRPDLAERFEVSQDGIIIVCGGPCDTATGTVRVVEPSEQEITRAIRSVISEKKKVYFLTGHGEGGIDDEESPGFSRVKAALEAENVIVETLLLASLDAVPDDADAVIVAGPTHSVLDKELDLLDAYLNGGGSVAVLADPIVVTNLEDRVRGWGIALGDDVIVDQTIDLFQGPRVGVQPVVNDYGEHPITADFKNAATIFQLARSVAAVNGDSETAVEVTELALTGKGSWAETDVELFSAKNQVGLDEGADRPGPIAVAAARVFASAAEDQREGRLVVVGDADFASNRHIAKMYNADFFLNTVNWLVGEESFITIDRKTPRASMAQMTRQQFATFQSVALFFLPEAIILLGIITWWRRRA